MGPPPQISAWSSRGLVNLAHRDDVADVLRLAKGRFRPHTCCRRLGALVRPGQTLCAAEQTRNNTYVVTYIPIH